MDKEINLFEDLERFTIQPESTEPAIASETPEWPQPSCELPERKKGLREQVKRIIEALLFSSNAPIAFNKIREVTDSLHPLRPRILRELLCELQHEYIAQQRAFRLEEIAQGFIVRTCEEYAPYIDLMHRNKRTEKLSHAAAEVLAIIAYKQPTTRPQIDAIRGVDSSGTLQNLLDRQLIEPVGRLEAPGRPTLYGITKEFLLHFGLKDIAELPKMHG
jgi:segregation and condensation protein B